MSKQDRIENINQLIVCISNVGRRFFYKQGNVSYMKIKGGRIYFADDYTKKDVAVINNYKDWPNFSHGGTLRALVLDFAEYIRIGAPSNGKHGYRDLLSSDWGCSDSEQSEMIAFAKTIGFIT